MSFQVRYWLNGRPHNLQTEVFNRLYDAETRTDQLQMQGYKSPTGFAYILDQTVKGDAAVINRIGGRTFRKD